jgi:hypothetical protein
LNAAFASWKAGFGVSGGCDPQYSDNQLGAPDYCGGSATVVWTVTDQCYTTTTHSATFSITAPPQINFTPPQPITFNSCDFNNQNDADAAFNNWKNPIYIQVIGGLGGCNPTITPDNSQAPSYCGGTTFVTWTLTDQCILPITYSSSFTITQPSQVVVNKPQDVTYSSCDYTSQSAVDAAFASWKAGFGVSGGCDPQYSDNQLGAPDYCGGSSTVVWTVTDQCYTTTTHSATFTITAPSAVVVTKPQDVTYSACDHPNQQAVNAVFASWKAGFGVSGGCDPQYSDNQLGAPDYCGGISTVIWTVTDQCYTTTTHSATFTITAPSAVVVTKPQDVTYSACDHPNQQAVNAVFASWKAGFGVSGGCDPQYSDNQLGAPDYCGGSATVIWTVTDQCYTTTTHSATFSITAPPQINFTPPQPITFNSCDFNNQNDADAAFNNWKNPIYIQVIGGLGGCNPTITPDNSQAPSYCGGTTFVTWTLTDQCILPITYSSSFTITQPSQVVVNKPQDVTYSSCDYPKPVSC